jgi:serine/threonine-protein kinase
MTGRRRLRKRYEPAVVPAPDLADGSPAPGTSAGDDVAPVTAPLPPTAPPASEPLDAGPVTLAAGAIAVAPPGASAAPPAAGASDVTLPVGEPAAPVTRPSPDVIAEWARGFEEPPVVDLAAEAAAEARRAWRRRVRSVLTMVGLAVAAFATGLVLFNNLVMPRLIHGVGQVTVPDLTNLTIEQAEQALRPLGLQVSRAGERFDPSAPRGFVIAQEPGAGTTVRGRKRIAVVVSLGEEYSSVPELFGESVRAARMLVERAGLRPGSVVLAPSEEAGEGMVAGSDPGPEAVLQRDTPVHLLVSTGAGSESFVMPELLGREVSGVRRQLEALGFRVERTGARTAVGTIVAQTPAPGSRITRADVIRLITSGRIIR